MIPPNPIIGTGLHAIGGISAASCYLPNTQTQKWSWGTFWLAQALFAWVIMPLLVGWLTVPGFFQILIDAPSKPFWTAFLLGAVYGFWWDAIRLREDVDQDPGLNQLIRKLQPGVVINNRGFDDGDFGTPERDYGSDDEISFDRPIQACQAVGMESWGYRKNEDYYTDRHLIRSIDKYLSRDANYLLNVGPDPLGVIPEQDRRILKNIGRWHETVNESFELEFAPQDHVVQKSYLRLINLPTNEMCNTILVIRLEFDRPPEELLQGTVAPEVIKDVQK